MHLLLLMNLFLNEPAALPVGKSTVQVQFGEIPLKLFAYKPRGFSDGPLLMVFHGVLRNAEEYRDDAMEMGDRFQALVIAPLFDEPTFPKPKYQYGGIVRDNKATPRDEWTGEYINRIAKEIRLREKRSDMPLYLIGHSGGGQFLIRAAAFVQTDAKRIVIANPGTHLFPNNTAPFPFGFGSLPAELQTEERIRMYLAQPITLFLGTDDTERDEHFDVTPPAEAQGHTRFERGRNCFAAAKALAQERKWEFGWKLVIANNIGHDHTKMFNNARCADALELTPRK